MNDTTGLTGAMADAWVQTASGVRFHPFAPRAEDIRLEDIAAHLSKLCRFGGACRQFYSVAQHSFHVSCALPEELAAWGLLHDAAEAYTGDLRAPVKRHCETFRAVERRIETCVAERFGLPLPIPEAVHDADRQMLVNESHALMATPIEGPGWPEKSRDLDDFYEPEEARELFLIRAKNLGLR